MNLKSFFRYSQNFILSTCKKRKFLKTEFQQISSLFSREFLSITFLYAELQVFAKNFEYFKHYYFFLCVCCLKYSITAKRTWNVRNIKQNFSTKNNKNQLMVCYLKFFLFFKRPCLELRHYKNENASVFTVFKILSKIISNFLKEYMTIMRSINTFSFKTFKIKNIVLSIH